ncbi:cilia- and flagella-associated protein 47 [Rhinatrema bivittatum]|uniref:cilia- and flagella-associated protein 47 n=1 Tax=Rhinatrema bivittatum TaxID=194408 RepID=UPI0011281F96|nr:cilia- and flagella-associated protein 47 [Rhinatrema bivittatum]
METDVAGVRIFPQFLQFDDVVVGGVYRQTLTVRNISSCGKRIAVYGPQLQEFNVIVANPEKPIAPGLQLTATVEYYPSKNEDIEEKLLICVDKDVFHIPLIGFIPCCLLEVDSEVDFGIVTANNRVICKVIRVFNHGSCPGAFKIKLKEDLPINIEPSSGIVEPKTMQIVKVDLFTDKPRLIEEIAKVKLQGQEDAVLKVKGNVVEQGLELLNGCGEILNCIQFGHLYFGTSKAEHVFLYNNGPEILNWVALLEDDAPGTELGADLQKGTDAVLQDLSFRNQDTFTDVCSLITCFPNQGILLPFQKISLFICFTPKQSEADILLGKPASQQDYALFLKFEQIGSKDDLQEVETRDSLHAKKKHNECVELAVTGSGIPVMLNFSVGPSLNFKECLIGERIDVLCTLKNQSKSLPLTLSFRKISHFNAYPAKARIQPRGSQDVIFSFAPHQVGTFKMKQMMDFIGATLEDSSLSLKTNIFHQMSLTFTGICRPVTNKVVMKLNPGITPLITNATGQYVHAAPEETGKYIGFTRVSMLNSAQTGLHSYQKGGKLKNDVLVAFPNDRCASIRSSDRQNKYRTIFTRVDRYNYVDPDFAFTDEEEAERQVHKDHYADYIKGLREQRLKEERDRRFEALNNPVDIGIKSALGLVPPKVSVRDLWAPQLKTKVTPLSKGFMLTTRELAADDSRSLSREFIEGLSAVPTSPQEKDDCSLKLTPKQLHQIVIGPSLIKFGEVCLCSISEKQMHIVNNLPAYIWVQLEIDCKELQQTSPLSHVVPPMSKTRIPVILETNTLGEFKKTIMYTINTQHTGYVLVTAEVVPVALELSTDMLILKPTPGLLVETGFRTTVTLYNRRNHPADFCWKPKIGEKGIAFSIRPARGTVEAFKDLDCEVVWHPGFSSPEEGAFSLCVQNGNILKLRCIAQLGVTNIQFIEERILFNQTPFGLTTWKTAILQNKGPNHAYFQILDLSPVPGMTLMPSQGVVPVGGLTKIEIFFTPIQIFKFDTKVEVNARNSKPIDLKVSGFVVPPDVDISMKLFYFHSVPINSNQEIPFKLHNHSVGCARIEFDFSSYPDFSIVHKDPSVIYSDPQNPSLYFVDLEGKKSLDCALAFNPKQVAAYDLNLPININGTLTVLSPAKSPVATTATQSQTTVIGTRSISINATASRKLLNISVLVMVFELPSGFCDLGPANDKQNTQVLEMHNTSKQPVTWKFDLAPLKEEWKDNTFKFNQEKGTLDPDGKSSITVSFCPSYPGKYTAEVPILVNEQPNVHFKPLQLFGNVKTPKLIFDPPLVILTPVPLDSETGEVVAITPLDYFRESALRVEIPEVKLEDDTISPLSLQFIGSQVVAVSSEGRSPGITCQINFRSSRPLSFLADVAFIDEDNNRFILQVAAASENCLLTLYPYLALYHSEQQVILKCGYNGNNGKNYNTGEAVLHPCYVPGTPSQSNSSSSLGAVTSTFFEDSLSDPSYDNITESVKIKNEEADDHGQGRKDRFELLFFPEEDTEEWIFFQKVVAAIQMWFTLFGWAEGSNPVSIPQSLRSAVFKIETSKADEKIAQKLLIGKETRTIYDMLFYLSGEMLPGITENQSLSSDPIERVAQLHWQHSTLLTFLKSQGACLPHVLPEFLLEPHDYKKWMELQVEIKELQKTNMKITSVSDERALIDMDEHIFESVSKRVWTDVLLQVYKVLVLSRVPPIKNRTELFDFESAQSIPRIKSDPLSSNIYSTSERVILTWLNTHYEKTRKDAWKECQKGDVPPMRWIVNFDKDLLDGLVLAALLAAYCPFLIPTHTVRMYTKPETPEQCLHNCLIVVNGFRDIGLDIDVQATDICDANPIMMLLLCVYLYEKLPMYLPEKVVEFHGSLHATIVKQVQLKNQSLKILVYTPKLIGREAADFSLTVGHTVFVRPKNRINIKVAFKSRFMHPAEATLLLVPNTMNGAGGATMAFSLKSLINKIVPVGTVRYDSPCYVPKEINLSLCNPLKTDGHFRIILIESSSHLTNPVKLKQIIQEKQANICIPSVLESSAVGETKSDSDGCLPQFFCSVRSLYLQSKTPTPLRVCFLPFALGIRYCSILLLNEEIGEFVYLIEGAGILPLPLPLLPTSSLNILAVSSTAPGYIKSQPVQYFKCNQNSILEEQLKIPLINESREKALAIAAQKQMSALEYERRKVTGTLESSSIRAAVAALGFSEIETHTSLTPSGHKGRKFRSLDYSVTVNMPKHFETPQKISIPVSAACRVNFKKVPKEPGHSNEDKKMSVDLPVKFVPGNPGRYPCQIVLHSCHDVRVYMIECVVNTSSTVIELDFTTPANQSVIQDIPITNMTQHDWKLRADLRGVGFYGPALVLVQAGKVSQYSLMFKPLLECVSMGKLCLQNEIDGVEHIFILKGIGLSPPALDHIVIDCQVKKATYKLLSVPNHTHNTLTLKVSSDLPMIIGAQTMTIPPGLTLSYPLSVATWKNGVFTGVISFEEDKDQQSESDFASEAEEKQGLQESSTGIPEEEHLATSGSTFSPYKVWFTVEIKCTRGPQEGTLTVNCTALDTVGIDIPITNPTREVLHLDVIVNGTGLKGAKSLVLKPKETVAYSATYSSASTGTFDGSILFQSDLCGEFWYALKMTSEKPEPTTLPQLECELGKWTRQNILLSNPTDEILELKIHNSNPGSFTVETDPQKLLLLVPHSTLEVPVQFYPSALGKANHKTSIIFMCPQLEEWIFHLSGKGLIPKPMESTSISTPVGCLSSIFITFKNPTDENVLVDVLLTDQEQLMHHLSASDLRQSTIKDSSFCVPLKETQGIPLSPKEKLDIPVMFSPDTMKLFEAVVVVHMVKENGENWEYNSLEDIANELQSVSITETGEISGIRWLYPIHGIPEVTPVKPEPAVVSCRARSRAEERIEVLLTGSVPGQSCVRPSRSKSLGDGIQDEVQVTEGFATTEEFLYEIQYESAKVKSQMECSVAINLVKKDRDPQSGIVTLIFNIIFLPVKPMKQPATLVVQSATGGIWRFPLLFVATETIVDDVINIEAIGVNKESMVGFRLTSQTRYPELFNAYFLPGSDLEFAVSPQTGELLPLGTFGTMITVGFKPSIYSKKHRATLVIQTATMQWTYEINGLPPQTFPPTNVLAKTDSRGHIRSATVKQRNFIRENLKLVTTAVSSPIKGASLVLRTK